MDAAAAVSPLAAADAAPLPSPQGNAPLSGFLALFADMLAPAQPNAAGSVVTASKEEVAAEDTQETDVSLLFAQVAAASMSLPAERSDVRAQGAASAPASAPGAGAALAGTAAAKGALRASDPALLLVAPEIDDLLPMNAADGASLAGNAQQGASGGSAAMTPSALPSLAQAAATSGATQQPDLPAGRAIQTPVGEAAWAEEIGTRVIMMAGNGQHGGALRLSPEHLGPLEVRISISDEKASVWFGAQHADTRAALQEALPRLRELFASQGMLLADAGVSRDAPRQEAAPPRPAAAADAAAGAVENPRLESTVTQITHGLIDTYA